MSTNSPVCPSNSILEQEHIHVDSFICSCGIDNPITTILHTCLTKINLIVYTYYLCFNVINIVQRIGWLNYFLRHQQSNIGMNVCLMTNIVAACGALYSVLTNVKWHLIMQHAGISLIALKQLSCVIYMNIIRQSID